MTLILACMVPTIQWLPADIITRIARLHTVNDRIIFPTIASGQMLITTWITEPLMTILTAFVLSTVQEFLAFLAAYKGLLLIRAPNVHLGLPTSTGDFDSLVGTGSTPPTMAYIRTRVGTVEASLPLAVAAARVGRDAAFIFGIFELPAEAEVLGQGLSILVLALRAGPVVPLLLLIILVEIEDPLLDAGQMHELVAAPAVPDSLPHLDVLRTDHTELLGLAGLLLDVAPLFGEFGLVVAGLRWVWLRDEGLGLSLWLLGSCLCLVFLEDVARFPLLLTHTPIAIKQRLYLVLGIRSNYGAIARHDRRYGEAGPEPRLHREPRANYPVRPGLPVQLLRVIRPGAALPVLLPVRAELHSH